MNRRKFITTSSVALLASQIPFSNILRAQEFDQPIVWEAEGISYEKIDALLLALGGVEKLISTDPAKATVVIKPNLCLPDGEPKGTTTSFAAMELICKWLISHGVKKIIITDHTLQKAADFSKIDIMQLPVIYPEVKVVLANEERMYESVEVPGKVLKKVEKMKLLSKADLFINFATAKHHTATYVSLGIKNLMGTIWNRTEFHTKMDLAQAIGDLALSIRPTVTLIDASRVLLNGGPVGPGPMLNDNRIFASYDIVAVDAVVTSRYNFAGKSLSPNDVAHLRAAAENGIGEINLNKIYVKKV